MTVSHRSNYFNWLVDLGTEMYRTEQLQMAYFYFVSINSTNLVVLVVPWYHLLLSFPCLRSGPEDLLCHRYRLCRLYRDHLYRRFYQGGQGHPGVRRDLEGLADRLAQELPINERI